MARLITKRNITLTNAVLAGVFLVTLIAVGVPFLKEKPTPSLYTDEAPSRPEVTAPPAAEETYACPRHPEVTSNAPGKCTQCDCALEKRVRFAAIVKRNVFFDPSIRKKPPPEVPAPLPLKLELVGVTKIGIHYVAVIRDKAKRAGRGFKEVIVREGEEIPDYFGVTILSITPNPPLVKYDRVGVGIEELKMGVSTPATAQARKDQWSQIIRPVRVGYTYMVKYRDLQGRNLTLEGYRGTFDLQPVTEGTRVRGLKITSLPRDNLLYAAGLHQGDVIETINGNVINDEASAVALLRNAARGPNIQVGITRGRSKRTIIYTLLKK